MKSFRLQSRAESKAEKQKAHEEYVKNFDEKTKNRNLFIASAGSIFGLFAFALVFYVSVFYLIFEGFKIYRVTNKNKYLAFSILASLYFIIVQGYFV